jgi:hypothetical protein
MAEREVENARRERAELQASEMAAQEASRLK